MLQCTGVVSSDAVKDKHDTARAASLEQDHSESENSAKAVALLPRSELTSYEMSHLLGCCMR